MHGSLSYVVVNILIGLASNSKLRPRPAVRLALAVWPYNQCLRIQEALDGPSNGAVLEQQHPAMPPAPATWPQVRTSAALIEACDFSMAIYRKRPSAYLVLARALIEAWRTSISAGFWPYRENYGVVRFSSEHH